MSDRRGKQRREPERRRVRVDVACNHPDNGVFDYGARFIEIGNLELAAHDYDRPPRFMVIDEQRFRLSGKVWKYEDRRCGVGNWCWDAFYMPLPDVADFINWLWGRKTFAIDQGPSALFDWWRDGKAPMERRLLTILIEEAIR